MITETVEFCLLNNFVAGKETAVFIDLKEPFDPKSVVMMSIERNGEPLAMLTTVDVIDEMTLLFQGISTQQSGKR